VVATTSGAASGGTINYTDTTMLPATTYYYRVIASNIIGDATFHTAPAVGFPNIRFDSAPSNTSDSVLWP